MTMHNADDHFVKGPGVDQSAWSLESASTPIAAGGWKYDHKRDRADFAGFTAEELRELEGYDFTDHPAMQERAEGGETR